MVEDEELERDCRCAASDVSVWPRMRVCECKDEYGGSGLLVRRLCWREARALVSWERRWRVWSRSLMSCVVRFWAMVKLIAFLTLEEVRQLLRNCCRSDFYIISRICARCIIRTEGCVERVRSISPLVRAVVCKVTSGNDFNAGNGWRCTRSDPTWIQVSLEQTYLKITMRGNNEEQASLISSLSGDSEEG